MFSERSRQRSLSQDWLSAGFLVVVSCLVQSIPSNADLKGFERVRGLTSIRFADERHGWIAGTKGVFWTQNAGQSWKPQNVTTAKIGGAAVLWPVDRAGKILWSDESRAVVTTDDGFVVCNATARSVRKVLPLGLTVNKTEDLVFTSFTQGWATAGGEVLQTIDGGKTWQLVMKSPAEGYVSLAARGHSVWALGYEGQFSWTKDEGLSWSHARLKLRGDYFERVAFRDEKQGWLFAGRSARKTKDGGVTWTEISLPLQEHSQVYSIDFADAQRGWIAGLGTIWASDDGGLHWTVKRVNIQDHIVGIAAVPNGKAWAVGRRGTVLRTEGRAADWVECSLDPD